MARYPSHEVQEATRSAVRELRYQDVKPEHGRGLRSGTRRVCRFADWLRKELVLRLPFYRIQQAH